MKEYLSPKIEALALIAEQSVMTSSTLDYDSNTRENYDSFDLFE